jgi:hypothetical protein
VSEACRCWSLFDSLHWGLKSSVNKLLIPILSNQNRSVEWWQRPLKPGEPHLLWFSCRDPLKRALFRLDVGALDSPQAGLAAANSKGPGGAWGRGNDPPKALTRPSPSGEGPWRGSSLTFSVCTLTLAALACTGDPTSALARSEELGISRER